MPSKKVNLQILHTSLPVDDQTVMLGEALIKRWKIPVHTISLRFGLQNHTVRLASLPRSDSIRMSESLASTLGLVQGEPLRLQYRSKSGTLQLGPVVGVMVSRIYSDASKPFGQTTSFCRELAEASRLQGGHVFFFSPQSLKASSQTLDSWVYTVGGWQRVQSPYPEVVYNRLTSRKLEHMPSVQHFIREVNRMGGTVFNERYLDKAEVFTALARDNASKPYLPESRAFRNYAVFKSMLDRHRSVFLKPIRGSLGKGIVKVTRDANQTFSCHFSNLNGVEIKRFPTRAKAFAAVSGKAKAQRYQIQQGLALIRNDGRPVDFRALTHKNENGEWALTSIVARIAGSNHFVSNLARGGSLSRVRPALENAQVAQPAAVHANLKKAAVDIAEGIDKTIPAHFGELGIDLAVDTRGRVWLLEVNSKPAKNDDTPLSTQKIRPSVKQLIAYAKHLSGL